MTPKLPLRFLIPLISLSAHALCSAAPITWGPATDTSDREDLIEGTIILALNGGRDDLIIRNGGASGMSDYEFDASNFVTIDFAPTGDNTEDKAGAFGLVNQYAPETIATTGNGAFNILLSSATFANGAPSGIDTGTLTLSGLIVGTQYQVQVFYNDQRDNEMENTQQNRIMIYGDGLGNTVDVLAGDPAPGVQTDAYGQFAVGTFTADAETQELTMDSTGGSGSGNVHYNAILVAGPADLNAPPQVEDIAVEVADATPANTLVATLDASDADDDDLSYTITAGDPGAAFSIDGSGRLRTTGIIDIDQQSAYQLTIEVSDGTNAVTATVDITVSALAGDAEITWGEAQDTLSVADLVSGTPVYARNGGADTITVAGSDFESITLGRFLTSVYGSGTMDSTGDANFDALISSLTFGGGRDAVELPGFITGLVPGRSYSVQVFFNDQRPAESGRSMSISDGQGNSVDIGAGARLGTRESDDYGQFAVGTFVAQAADQFLELEPGGAGFGNSHLNAIYVVENFQETITSITSITFDPDTDEVSLTWTSQPDTSYAITYSLDLADFDQSINNSIDAAAGTETSLSFTLPAAIMDQERIFFRVEVAE